MQGPFLRGGPIDLCLETESALRLPRVALALGPYALPRPGHWAEQPRLLLLASGSCCMFPCQSGPCQSGPCQSFQGRGLQAVLRTGTVGSIWVYRSRRTVQLNSRSPALWLINGLCLRPWLSDILHAGLLTAACVTSHLILTTSLRAGYRFTDEEAEEERV